MSTNPVTLYESDTPTHHISVEINNYDGLDIFISNFDNDSQYISLDEFEAEALSRAISDWLRLKGSA